MSPLSDLRKEASSLSWHAIKIRWPTGGPARQQTLMRSFTLRKSSPMSHKDKKQEMRISRFSETN